MFLSHIGQECQIEIVPVEQSELFSVPNRCLSTCSGWQHSHLTRRLKGKSREI